MGKTYQKRSAIMEQAIQNCGLQIAGKGSHGGSSFWMQAPKSTDTEELAVRLRDESILIEPGQKFFAGSTAPREFYRLAYSSIPADRIAQGIEKIAKAIG